MSNTPVCFGVAIPFHTNHCEIEEAPDIAHMHHNNTCGVECVLTRTLCKSQEIKPTKFVVVSGYFIIKNVGGSTTADISHE